MDSCYQKMKTGCEPSDDDGTDPNAEVFAGFHWDPQRVGQWVEEIGYPQYKQCFIANMISGKRLVFIDACTLPSIGIHNFEHIKLITAEIRKFLNIKKDIKVQSKVNRKRDPMEEFLLQKIRNYPTCEDETYRDFKKRFDCLKFEPPLANYGKLVHDESWKFRYV